VTANKFEAGETTYLDPRCLPDMVPISEEEARALAGPPRPPLIVTGVDHPTGTITLEEGEPPEEKTPRVVPVSPNMPPGTPAPDPAETPGPQPLAEPPPPDPAEAPEPAPLAPLGSPAPAPLDYRGTRYVLNVAQDIAAVSSRLTLAQVVVQGAIDVTNTMRAQGLVDLKFVSAARTDRGIEIVIEGKGP
jgi:hypothetical protein